MKKLNTILLILCLGLTLPAMAQAELIKETQVTNEALHYWYPNNQKAYIYAATISPRGDCFTVANGYIFFGWYKGGMDKRNLMLSRKKIGENTWKTIQFSHKNTLIVDPRNKTGPRIFGNTHQTITVAVSEDDGKVHILFDHHNDPLNYIVSKANIAFASNANFKVSNFENKRSTLTVNERLTITYPEINKNDNGDLVLNYRRGNSHGGSEFMHVYSNGRWSRSKRVVQGYQAPVPANRNNYAYGSPTYGNGRFYYAFSVRWDNNRSINEGVYVADAGPTMTGNWKRVVGNTNQTFSPSIINYAPFLIDSPASENNQGSNGIPEFAINDNGDMQIGWKGRGNNSRYFYTYTKKKNQNSFTRHDGVFIDADAYGDKFYSVSIKRARNNNNKIIVKSNEAGNINQTTELEIPANHNLGSFVKFIHEGVLYLMFDVRAASDKHEVRCYEIQLNSGSRNNNNNNDNNDISTEVEDVDNLTDGFYRIKNLETGRYLRSLGGGDIVAASVVTGGDKHWSFVKTGNFYNIDSRTNGDGSGILRAINNTIIGTKRSAPRTDVDKIWKLNEVSSPRGAFRIELGNSNRYIYNETSNENKVISLSRKIGDRSKWLLEPLTTSKTLNNTKSNLQDNSLKDIVVYPNPTSNNFTIKLNGLQKGKVYITNMLGKLVYSNTINESLHLVQNKNLSNGVYFIKVIDENHNIYTKKLVVN